MVDKDIAEQWVQVTNELNLVEAELKIVNSKLNSWYYVFAKTELTMQKNTLSDRVDDLKIQFKKLNQERLQISSDIKNEHNKNRDAYAAKQRELYMAEYNKNSKVFIAGLLFDLPADKVKIYAAAEKIIAINSVFKFGDNNADLWRAWNIVDAANQLAHEEYKSYDGKDEVKEQKLFNNNEKFYLGAKQMFAGMMEDMPAFQGLMFLYASGERDKVNGFLKTILLSDKAEDFEIKKTIDLLVIDISRISYKNAKLLLSNIAGFTKLPSNVQQELTVQQSYVNKLLYDLSFITQTDKKTDDLELLQQYAKDLERNIRKAIDQNRTLTQCKQDYEAIKKQIDVREQNIRSLWFKQRLTDKPYITLGLGLGLAWMLGTSAPVAGFLVGGVALVKAHLETSHMRMQIPDIDDSRALIDLVLPVDYEFLQKFDALWGRGANVPFDQARVEIKTIDADATNFIVTGRDALIWPIIILYSMQVFTSALIFIAAGMMLPIVWPLFATLGVGVVVGLTYIAGNKILENVNITDYRIYKVAKAIVDAIDFAVIRPAKYLFDAVINWLNKPDQRILSDNSPVNLNFSLVPESVAALERIYPGLARQLSVHFTTRGADLEYKISMVKDKKNRGENIDKELSAINLEYKNLDADWLSIISSIDNKSKFCQAADRYLDKMYEIERKQFITAAALLFGNGSTAVDSEKEKVQELCRLKTTITTIKAQM